MGERYEVRISGTGGQGVVLAGIILAEAVGRWQEGRYVVQTVSYGPQVRGGMSNAEVVISDEEIDYPRPISLDLLVPFTQDGANQAAGLLKPNGLVLMDPDLIHHAPPGWVAAIPLTRLAVEHTGREQMTNIVTLGAISALCPMLEPDALDAALEERARADLKDVFLKAAEVGRLAAEQVKGSIHFEEQPAPGN